MQNLKNIFIKYLKINFSIIILVLFSKISYSNSIEIEIQGNSFTDDEAIISLIKNEPTTLSENYSNYIIKTLDNSQLFENVSVKIQDDKFIIYIEEYPNINKINFYNNERLKDEELLKISNELNLFNLNPSKLNRFISEVSKIYESFGYNNTKISFISNIDKKTNTTDLSFDITEGEITKINKITFSGNFNIESQSLKTNIKSKTKTLTNLFANNNYKKFAVENDTRIISNIYKNKGYLDIFVDYKVEFLDTNKVNIYFEIIEGEIYNISSIELLDEDEILNEQLSKLIDDTISNSLLNNSNYSINLINELKQNITDIIISNDIDFFEIDSLEKVENNNVDLLYKIYPIKPNYVNQINIYGNTRTYDFVIRRELELIEGDAIYKRQINKINNKLKSLNLFKSLEVVEKEINENQVNLEIIVEEKQTGTVNAGLSIGTLDGFAIIAGLNERNFYGTGRSLKALVNTSEDKTQFTLQTTDRILYENNVDITLKADLKEEDFSKASSYQLDTFTTGIGIGYDVNKKLRHNINIDYLIKDYSVTNSSKVATAIGNSSGQNVSFLLGNNLYYSTLNSGFLPKKGRLISFNNIIETPTSSNNGFIKNFITFKQFKNLNKNIISAQSRIGNVTSLSNNDILTDDKFSLGGRWLRGFDSYGAGPRNSRNSYVGGNNLFVTKLDYSRELLNNSDFPIFLNLFNDYGIVWENKTKPTNNDNNLRSSVGFGIKYYSPIGPIGLTWGFPIVDEDYDIRRMFLFSVGNID